MQLRTKPLASLLLAFASTTLAFVACGGSSSSSKDTSNATTSSGGAGGTGDGGVTDAGGTNGTSTSNSSTNANAATNASNTVAGDAGGSGGTSSTAGGTGGTAAITGGGAGGTSGAAGESASSDSGGTAGSGGTGPTGVIGVLGEPCDAPGQLACAGNHQKLTVVCGGDGEWEVNETCSATAFCDSTEEETTGLCVEPSAECMERSIDERFCQDGDAYWCTPDGLVPTLAEVCDVRCVDGACVNETDACPAEGIVFNCDPACGELWDGCEGGEEMTSPAQGVPVLFRTAGTSDASVINCDGGASYYYLLQLAVPVPTDLKVSAAPPWRVMFEIDALSDCDFGSAETCAITGVTERVLLVTDDPEAPPTNVLFEYADFVESCP